MYANRIVSNNEKIWQKDYTSITIALFQCKPERGTRTFRNHHDLYFQQYVRLNKVSYFQDEKHVLQNFKPSSVIISNETYVDLFPINSKGLFPKNSRITLSYILNCVQSSKYTRVIIIMTWLKHVRLSVSDIKCLLVLSVLEKIQIWADSLIFIQIIGTD